MKAFGTIGVAVIAALGFAGVASAGTCAYEGVTYSHGSTTCQSGSQFRCDEGEWESIGIACPPKEVMKSSCEFKGTTFSSGAASCQSGTQYKCEAGSWKSLGVACPPDQAVVPPRVPAGDAPRTCMLDGSTVGHSSTVCKSGVTYLCENGEWRNLGTPCK